MVKICIPFNPAIPSLGIHTPETIKCRQRKFPEQLTFRMKVELEEVGEEPYLLPHCMNF